MLNELSRFDNLGSHEEILFILDMISHSTNKKLTDIEKYSLDNDKFIHIPIRGIFKLLSFLDIILIKDGFINFKNNHFNIKELLITKIIEKGIFDIDWIKYSSESDFLYIRNNEIPLIFSNFKNLMIKLEILHFDISNKNIVIINNHFTEKFACNIKKQRKIISLEQLKKSLHENEKNGELAELYVLQYEKRNFNKSKLFRKIKRISEIDATAGYDIISFINTDSIKYDKFIEVKSYRQYPHFFWTKNEMEVAKKLGDKYFLYLVDLNEIEKSNYIPTIIKNPSYYLYNNNSWAIRPDSWYIEKVLY